MNIPNVGSKASFDQIMKAAVTAGAAALDAASGAGAGAAAVAVPAEVAKLGGDSRVADKAPPSVLDAGDDFEWPDDDRASQIAAGAAQFLRDQLKTTSDPKEAIFLTKAAEFQDFLAGCPGGPQPGTPGAKTYAKLEAALATLDQARCNPGSVSEAKQLEAITKFDAAMAELTPAEPYHEDDPRFLGEPPTAEEPFVPAMPYSIDDPRAIGEPPSPAGQVEPAMPYTF